MIALDFVWYERANDRPHVTLSVFEESSRDIHLDSMTLKLESYLAILKMHLQ